MEGRRRGRPTNHKLSQKSKDLISKSRTGQKHKEKTKEKIRSGVLRQHETGAPIDIIMKTDLSKCGKFIDQFGYVIISIPNPIIGAPTYKQKQHVAIMEQYLERKMLPGEEIHHWGQKDDNRLIMLSLCKDRKEHTLLDKTKKMLLSRYEACEDFKIVE